MDKNIKQCTQCKATKSLSDFYIKKSRRNGLSAECKDCNKENCKQYQLKNKDTLRQKNKNRWNKNREKINSERRAWRKKNKDKVRDLDLKRNYGITLKDKENLLINQNNVCAIKNCIKIIDMKTGHVDHNHFTGQIRGLLCSNCNTALGLLKENFDRILGLAKYIQEYNNII